MKLLQDEVLAMLRKIANASTVKSFEDSVKELKNSNIWKEHQHFRNWIGVTWLPLHEVKITFLTTKYSLKAAYDSLIIKGYKSLVLFLYFS